MTRRAHDLSPLPEDLGAIAQEAIARRRHLGGEHVSDDRVTEAEPETVDAEDAPIAELFESFDERDRIDLEQRREHFGLQRLRQCRGRQQDAEQLATFRAAAREEKLAQRTAQVGTDPLAIMPATRAGCPPVRR